MVHAMNKVIEGDYEGCSVISVFGEVQIIRALDTPVFIDSNSIEFYEMMQDKSSERVHCIKLIFQDGKKSVLELDRDICTAIIKNCSVSGTIRCGVTPEKIKACDPHTKEHCKDCICLKCIVWPKCCYGRMFARRKSYNSKMN